SHPCRAGCEGTRGRGGKVALGARPKTSWVAERRRGCCAFVTRDRRAAAGEASAAQQARAVAGSRGEGGGSLRSQLGLFARLRNRACSFAALASPRSEERRVGEECESGRAGE